VLPCVFDRVGAMGAVMAGLKLICCGGIAAVAILAGSTPAFAEAPGPRPAIEIADCASGGEVEKADEALLESVMPQFKAGGGFAALKPRLPELEAALAHAPPVLHRMELCGDVIVVHTDGAADTLLGLAQAANLMKDQATLDKALHGRPRPVKAIAQSSPYVMLSFWVGTTYNELRQYDRALAALEKGLALAPTNPILVNEDAMALIASRRAAEAVALCDRALAAGEPIEEPNRARLYRTRGFGLGELKRYAEAKASYEESLKYDPNNGGALNEIRYYERLIAGGAPTAVEITTSGKFRQKPAPQPQPQPEPQPPQPQPQL
jgi:tetratricopeptide (TPR) repeat protein